MFYPEGLVDFALEKSFIPILTLFYYIDVCRNGHLQNIVPLLFYNFEVSTF